METILKAENVSRDFTTGGGNIVKALTDIHLTVNEGELVCLRGRSGSGKTTLVNILGALDRQSGGEVWFCGEELGAMSDGARDLLRRKKLAFVFQSVALISTMTAYENVEFALRLAGVPIAERSKRAKECLARVGLERRMKHRPGELSGGEQQRVAIARAVAHKPKIIFADEPTAALDTQTGIAVVRLFRELVRDDGITVVMTTHDETMMELADLVYSLSDGKIADTVRNDVK
ncbi:MAG: ABC transporter ATP-binding protein [Bacteroides sp.]|nr:ABC transporter ATP-binding protein [Eubacterium sp.]MCM1418909.1 ABC transporter ATP-binding protein [Roseburia sp.]MCM1461517.1 ABC transporter ATP-binding protein [Bacteroides sp.]